VIVNAIMDEAQDGDYTINDGWFSEAGSSWQGQRTQIALESFDESAAILYDKKSSYQDILVFKSAEHGNVSNILLIKLAAARETLDDIYVAVIVFSTGLDGLLLVVVCLLAELSHLHHRRHCSGSL
jgi:hypothetical protein